METIEIKNFGPIKNIKINVKDINIFIGSTSSGKSITAKLISIFKSAEFIQKGDIDTFINLLSDYNIKFELKKDTLIKYCNEKYVWKIQGNKITDNFPFKGIVSAFKPFMDDLFLSRKKIDKMHFSKITLSLLFLNLIDFDKISVESKEVMDEKTLMEISNLLENIKDKRDKISHGEYSELNETIEFLGKFYSKIKDEIDVYDPLYIPAERILLSMVAESVFGLMKNDISLANCIKDFGSHFETARKQLEKHEILFLKAKYEYKDKTNFIVFEDGAKIKLEQASSGFQSIIPLILVIENFIKKKKIVKHCLVIEEPELNLYPTVQKELLEYLIGKVNESHDKLIITTHSPYLLTTLDNLIQAKNVVETEKSNKDAVKRIIPEKYWVKFDRVACYYFDNGECNSTLDEELKMIGATKIDDVSEELGRTFDELMDLKYPVADEL